MVLFTSVGLVIIFIVISIMVKRSEFNTKCSSLSTKLGGTFLVTKKSSTSNILLGSVGQ